MPNIEAMKAMLKRNMPEDIPLTDELRAQGFRRDKSQMTPEEKAAEVLQEEERFRLWTLQDWAAMTPKPPIIAGMWDYGRNALIYGPPGVFKSFIVMDIACRVALGDRSTGLMVEEIDNPPKVAYIAGEGAHGWRKRIRAMDEAAQSAPVLLGVEPWHMDPGEDPENVNPEYREGLRRLAEERVDIIVFDTLQTMRAPFGGDTNQAKTIAGLYEYPRAVQQEIRRLDESTMEAGRSAHVVSALWVHHANKSGQVYRGSGALTADADAVWRIANRIDTSEGYRVTLKAEKARDSEPIDWEAHLRPVKEDDGTVLSLRVVEWRRAGEEAMATTDREYDTSEMRGLFDDWLRADPAAAASAAQRKGRGTGGELTVGQLLKVFALQSRRENAKLPKGHHGVLGRWLHDAFRAAK